VVASNGNDKLKVGDFVQSMHGWREWYVSGGQDVQKFEPQTSIQSYLGALGMPGMTAYVGLMRIAALKDGERVFVSAAHISKRRSTTCGRTAASRSAA